MKGILIENSFMDTNVLAGLETVRTWHEDDWKLREVHIRREEALVLGQYLNAGPWYLHFWEPGQDDVLVVFKDAVFDIKHSDKRTWTQAVEHGRAIGIPSEQLDFRIT